jgi:2Fe-2S ferredoxin
MPKVSFIPLGRSYAVRPGGSVLRAAIRARVPLARACRGDAVCASCRVRVLAGAENLAPMTAPERALADREPLAPGERYACQAAVLGDVEVTTSYWGASQSGSAIE